MQVTWVGTSSMEITVEVIAQEYDVYNMYSATHKQPDGSEVLLAVARFLMVARDATSGHARPVPQLHLATAQDSQLFSEGLARHR